MSDQEHENSARPDGPPPPESEPDPFSIGPMGLGLLLFALGIGVGFPLAIVSNEFLTANADVIVSVAMTALLFLCVFGAVILVLRKKILAYLFSVTTARLDQFAGPLADTARYIVDRQPAEAVASAERLTKLAFARWAWISTRRWLIASLTGLLAAMAALAGTALLFRQNELLAVQTLRLEQQNELIQTQTGLGEAQRSAGILPGLLDIGVGLAEETQRLKDDGRSAPIFGLIELSEGLRARMIAATLATRPYQYLQGATVDPRDTNGLLRTALARRPEIVGDASALEGPKSGVANILIDRPKSPERGVIITLLHGAGIYETELLSFFGADFSYAEIRNPTLAQMSFRHARLRFSDFSWVHLNSVKFGAAELEHARFRNAVLKNTDFSGIPTDKVEPPYKGDPDTALWPTSLAGADFSGAALFKCGFATVNALVMNFDGALLSEADFSGSAISGGTFRQAILVAPNFSGAELKGIDLDGAIVFDKDFLDRLERDAAPATFIKSRYTIELIDIAELQRHPLAHQFFAVPEELIDGVTPYRVRRVADYK